MRILIIAIFLAILNIFSLLISCSTVNVKPKELEIKVNEKKSIDLKLGKGFIEILKIEDERCKMCATCFGDYGITIFFRATTFSGESLEFKLFSPVCDDPQRSITNIFSKQGQERGLSKLIFGSYIGLSYVTPSKNSTNPNQIISLEDYTIFLIKK